MPEHIYPWKRRWIPRDDETGRNLPDNWLTDFYYSGHSAYNSYEIDELLGLSCLILLGEPGMGKSSALNDLTTKLVNDEDNRYCFFNLADYESYTDLRESLFGDNPDFQEWLSGKFRLHFFLDSLDEARLEMKAVAKRIFQLLNSYSDVRSRMAIRIACRTSDWPIEQEPEIEQLWGKDFVQAFVLAPLQSEDISVALEIRGVDERKFQEEIRVKSAASFCNRPMTFNLLLDEYCQTGKLPNTRYELYRRGCEALCREINPSHAKKDELHPEQRFLIAARIAAIMVFTGHSSIQPNSSAMNESNVLNIEAFIGEQNSIDGLSIGYVYEAHIRETLETALFRGNGKRQWVHQTYAEFLAGWYVAKTLKTPQILSFLFHPSGRVIPQLRETAAWIAGLNNEIGTEILKTDPEILLRSDVAVGDHESRNRLAEALLQRADSDPRFRTDWSRTKFLANPALASVLRPYLENTEKSTGARRLAILCADECEIAELQDALLKIALNPNEPVILRDAAIDAIARIGSDDSKIQLRPVALTPLGALDSGDLKMAAIRCVWPQFLTTDELFGTLDTYDREDSVLDTYTTANWCNLILPNLSIADIPIALKWVQRQRRSHDLSASFAELFDDILILAWDHLGEPDIAVGFAETAVILWSRHDDIYNRHGFRRTNRSEQENHPLSQDNVHKQDDRRHVLLNQLIPFAARFGQDMTWNFISDVPFLRFVDVPQLIDYFHAAQSPDEKHVLISLVHRIIDWRDQSQFAFIYKQGEDSPELWAALNYQLSIELNSPEAAEAKERYERIRIREEEHKEFERRLEEEEQPISPSPTEQVRKYLKQLSEGDANAWWLISKLLMYLPNGRYNTYHQVSPSLKELPVWDTLHDTEKSTIIEKAAAYLNSYDCESLDWRANWETIYYPIVAGYRALFVACTDNGISQINFKWLSNWIPALVSHIYKWAAATGDGEPNPKEFLLGLLYRIYPDKTIETFVWLAGKEDEKGEHFLPSHISSLWDEQFSRVFLAEVQTNRFSPRLTHSILQQISAHNYDLIDDLLRKWLTPEVETTSGHLEQAYSAASLLLQHADEGGWSLLGPIFHSDKEFGKEVIGRIAGEERYSARIASRLTEKDAADFYIWLHECFPPETDPRRTGSGFRKVTLEDEIASFRNLVLHNLMGRGTEECIYSLRHIQKTLNVDFTGQIIQAEEIWRNASWQPPSIQEMRALIQDQQKRWIHTGSQLLDVLTELLTNLNDDLQGQANGTPAAIDLWNEFGTKGTTVYTPKDENRLSDYVARYLRSMLVDKNLFISRESQIRRGSFTDIYIETRPVDGSGQIGEPIVAIIEVKGCWHSELNSAMETQLRDRYLKENGVQHGLYLIGRFMCEKWDNTDSRWRRSPKNTMVMDMQELFTQQAKELSVEGLNICAFVLDAAI